MPYPLDFSAYHPLKQVSPLGPLRVLWLGRIVPRKRLDLLLDGALRALQRGVDLRLDIIGGVGFAQGLASLIGRFPRPDVLQHVENVPHARVGAVLAQADVLAQPSEEEDFGSSVAEAMACGTPALLGPTNGMRDYACPKSIVLERGSPDAVADALTELAHRKKAGTLRNATVSRCWAERWFDPKGIATRFLQECAAVVAERNKTVHRANGDLAG
ncbi:MAG: glycosyltransferase [Planctomycetota bacterium]